MMCLSSDDMLMLRKFEEVQAALRDPDEDPASVPFTYSLDEVEVMARLWERGLIIPASAASAKFTSAGLNEARRLGK
jgi:hypothetical protein